VQLYDATTRGDIAELRDIEASVFALSPISSKGAATEVAFFAEVT
jgi:hypothetical protein